MDNETPPWVGGGGFEWAMQPRLPLLCVSKHDYSLLNKIR